MKLRSGTPEEGGVSPGAIVRIRERCEGWVKDGLHSALVVIAAHRGVIFLEEAYWKLSPAHDAPDLKIDAIFGLSSLSKPITSTCAMILVEDGLLGLNRPLQEYIPEFVGEGKEQAMVHQLLTHTAGLSDDAVVEVITKKIEDKIDLPEMDETQHPRNHGTLHYGYDTPLSTCPGEVMVYGEQLLSPSYSVHGGSGGVVLWIDPIQEIVGVFFSILTQTLDDRPLLGADLFMNIFAAAVED
ncbi:MAG: beta-lactamase family protein [Chloroflexi bacterium]|nr:beta-lactamase family protein [Chloroflexota bacterium]